MKKDLTNKTKESKKDFSPQIKTIDLQGVDHQDNTRISLLEQKPHNTVLAQYVRVYQINQRQGTASTKTRAEVRGTTKKIYKQKGTGKARHGSKKAPIFKGGGIVGGPKPKEYRLKLNKKQKKLSLLSSLQIHYNRGTVFKLIHDKKEEEIKTKTIASFLKKLNLYQRKTLFVFTKDVGRFFILAVRNIKNVSYTVVDSLNAYELLKAETVFFVNNALENVMSIYEKKDEN